MLIDSFFDMRDDFERRRRDGEDVVVGKKTTLFLSSPSSFFDQFVAGAASGLAARLVTHPMDTIKSRMQVHAATRRTGHRGGALPRSGFERNMITTTTNKNAFFGYYKGFGAVALGSPFASGMYFLGYETTKKTLAMVHADDASAETTTAAAAAADNVLTGIVAQALAGIAYTPVDVIKERMQVSSVLPKHLKTNNGIDYRNVFDAVKTIAQNEGVKNGLMRGYWAQNFVWWPWSASYFVVYEKGVEIFSRSNTNNNNNNNNNDDDDDSAQTMYNVSPHAASAFTAATFATVLTHPLDLCKTRIQTMSAKGMNGGGGGGGGGSLTLKMACVDVVKTEGVLALYRGVWARILSVAPGSAISFYAYESIRKSGMLRLDD